MYYEDFLIATYLFIASDVNMLRQPLMIKSLNRAYSLVPAVQIKLIVASEVLNGERNSPQQELFYDKNDIRPCYVIRNLIFKKPQAHNDLDALSIQGRALSLVDKFMFEKQQEPTDIGSSQQLSCCSWQPSETQILKLTTTGARKIIFAGLSFSLQLEFAITTLSILHHNVDVTNQHNLASMEPWLHLDFEPLAIYCICISRWLSLCNTLISWNKLKTRTMT